MRALNPQSTPSPAGEVAHLENADIVYLDFSKALDKVDLGILLKEVKELDIYLFLGH